MAAAFVASRVAVAIALYRVAGGAELSWDARFYVYLAAHPWAVITGETLAGPPFAAALVHYPPLLGLVLAAPYRFFGSFLPTFFATRAALAFLEAAALIATGVCLRPALARPNNSGALTSWAWLAVFLPWGWITTVFWVQDEILLAPFVTAAMVASWRGRPIAATMALTCGALVAKFLVLAFVPIVLATASGRPRRLAAALTVGFIMLAAYSIYYYLRFGIIPLIDYDTSSGGLTSLSVFSALTPFFPATPAGRTVWTWGVKAAMVAAVTAPALFIWRRRKNPLTFAATTMAWLTTGVALLAFNPMGQPEYLAWFAFLVPAAIVAVRPSAKRWPLATAAVALCAAAWGWNFLNAVKRWSAVTTDVSTRHAVAVAFTATAGPEIVAAGTAVCAAAYFLGWAVWLWFMGRPRIIPGIPRDFVIRPAAEIGGVQDTV